VDLTGRVALVTGGKRIGSVIATQLAAGGADIALTYRASLAEAEQTAADVRALGRRALALRADLSDPLACQAVVQQTVDTLGRLDVLIALASIYTRIPYDELTADHWSGQLAVDLSASFHCAHAAVPFMRQAGGGRIVLFSDWVAASGRPRYKGYLPYYVAKAGVIALGEALALELAVDDILVNVIAPGPIVAPPGMSDEESEAVMRATPLGKWGGEEEIAKAVRLLVETDFITGEVIRVDGGRHLS